MTTSTARGECTALEARSSQATVEACSRALLHHSGCRAAALTRRAVFMLRSVALAQGADVNLCLQEGWGWRPLHCAVRVRSSRVLQVLLAAPGVEINAPNNKGERPLDMCKTAEDARALLDAGAMCAASSKASLSSLHYAAHNARPDVVKELIARGADVHEVALPEIAQSCIGVDFGGTVLHFAVTSICHARAWRSCSGEMFSSFQPEMADAVLASARRVAVVEALIAAGADVNSLSTNLSSKLKMTPLMVAARWGDSAVITALLRAGAPADAVESATGETALHVAVQHGHTDAIYALVAGGARVDQAKMSNTKWTPLYAAVLLNKFDAARALLELGADTTGVVEVLAFPHVRLLPSVIDATMRELVARHVAGRSRPARACALPACEARRRVDYDDKKLLACPCKARALAVVLICAALSDVPPLPCSCHAQLAFYCCKEHQVADRKRHKAACRAALAQQAGGGSSA